MNFDYQSHAFDLAKSTGLHLCTGALLSKVFFPVVVKEGAAYGALLGAATSITEKAIFHLSPLEENAQNKTLIALATLAVAYIATTKLIAGPLLGRIAQEFSADKAFKLCLSSFGTYLGYTIWQKNSRKEPEPSHDPQGDSIPPTPLKDALNGFKDVHDKNKLGQTALHVATVAGDENAIATLLKAGADIHAKDEDGYTPIHAAAEERHVNAIELLLSNSANIQATDQDGCTPLHIAALFGYVNAIKTLFSKGADIHALDQKGDTPLHAAAFEGHVNAIETLLTSGADIHALDQKGHTPLHYAAYNGHVSAIELLLSNSANIHALDQDGSTPLHLAAFDGDVNAIETLLSNGADIHALDQKGCTPLQIAEEEGLEEAKKILQKAQEQRKWYNRLRFWGS
ncbi:ankyrin repeat domain-containing protein [Simkania sp.]|uniref:ankyrin repeat domain-containing protein n=1 Tax=Simkania sp. TaxID=34094 RepID=UPI003B52E6B5